MSSQPVVPKREWFGEKLPGCEPGWYQGLPSPYYHEGHKVYRAKCRKFVEEEIKPNVDTWIKTGYPKDLHVKARKAGVLLRSKALGGHDDFDAFYEMITIDELARVGGGSVLGQVGINSMALPPIVAYGTDMQKKLVVDDVAEGRKHICLAISEPGAGSDVANIQAKAVKEGDYYVVSGFKKWITGGNFGDYFTTAVRTGGKGMSGISLLLIDRNLPGITIRKMETQFDNSHSTTFITFDKVKVPKDMLIGRENQGFRYLMYNFNHERFVIAASAARSARMCYEEAFKYSMERKTFGKRLIDHQLVRFKLAEMLRMIESLQDQCEKVAYAIQQGVKDHELGMQCALLKVNASKTFEYCAREASQIFGGSSIVKEGKGKIVERLYREVRCQAIPGGSEEILLDFTMRQAAAQAAKL
eukprot:TRINITY_DN1693_c0_g3_i5.p1 TRINITY_DN1693_c0_g3~~TRINITY_DN1693_c0_g3_i5.p1  ORF type:complete len:415 (+),score=139.69 TRINITY_DN1693_c0_g3_i5:57-1301(+)